MLGIGSDGQRRPSVAFTPFAIFRKGDNLGGFLCIILGAAPGAYPDPAVDIIVRQGNGFGGFKKQITGLSGPIAFAAPQTHIEDHAGSSRVF